jgi:predicted GTPase
MERRQVLILGAAGRDFHNFDVLCSDDPSCEVVAFTAQQTPHIADRMYPADLAGEPYPAGTPSTRKNDSKH